MTTPEPTDDHGSAASHTLVSSRALARRPLGTRYVLGLFVLPILLTAGIGRVVVPKLESDLQQRGQEALTVAGVIGATLEFDGRVAQVKVPTGQDPEAAEVALAGLDGVWRVETGSVYRSAKEAKACATLQKSIDKATRGQRIPFVGTATQPTAEGKQMIAAVAKLLKGCRAASVVVGGHSDDGTVGGSTISLKRAQNMVRQLRAAGIADRRLLPRGYGDQFMIDQSDTPAGDARNQRGSVVVEER